MQRGAVIVYDDYGFPTCPGARKAVDDFFADKPEMPLVLTTDNVSFLNSRFRREKPQLGASSFSEIVTESTTGHSIAIAGSRQ